MTFDEYYGELPKSTLRMIKRYNVSPADYTDLEYACGEGNFAAIEAAIQRFSTKGYFCSFDLFSAIFP